MSASWVAGTVRARALTRRRLGAVGARQVARSASLAEAAKVLEATPYGHDRPADSDLAGWQHAVGTSLLWHLRVLAGWLPRGGAQMVRVLAGGFEVANVEERVGLLRDGANEGTVQEKVAPEGVGQEGAGQEPAYRLGALETAWSRIRRAASLEELREVLAASRWGDPGGASPWSISMAVRLGWADRIAARIPQAAAWARAAAVLLLVRQVMLEHRRLDEPVRMRASSLAGPRFVAALSAGSPLSDLAGDLPSDTRWVLDRVDRPQDLWRAEAGWVTRVERDGLSLLHRSTFGASTVLGAVAVLMADAWRVRAALECAARGGTTAAMESFDAVA